MNNIESKMEELNYYAEVWETSMEDALAEILFTFYEAAGFDSDILAEELGSKTNEELMQIYLEL